MICVSRARRSQLEMALCSLQGSSHQGHLTLVEHHEIDSDCLGNFRPLAKPLEEILLCDLGNFLDGIFFLVLENFLDGIFATWISFVK